MAAAVIGRGVSLTGPTWTMMGWHSASPERRAVEAAGKGRPFQQHLVPGGDQLSFGDSVNHTGTAGLLITGSMRCHCNEMNAPSTVRKRSIIIAGHKTSVSIEDEFWEAVKQIARERRATLSDLVAEIDARRTRGGLSSAVRLHVLEYYRERAR